MNDDSDDNHNNSGIAPAVGITLDAVLARAPAVKSWLESQSPSAADPAKFLAVALDLGFRFVQQVDGFLPAQAFTQASSADKGAKGEDEIYLTLRRARRVRDVSHRAHSGDLVCDTSAGPVLVEVKHYTTSVPSAERDKFVRDLRERGAVAGVFLSLTSPIVGMKHSVEVVLEPQVSAGALVPVVYAAPAKGTGATRLSADVAVAALDMAACLAEVYPRGTRGLHPRDPVLAWSVATDQLAEGAASIRTELATAVAGLAGSADSIAAALAMLGREARDLSKSQRAEVEEPCEVGATVSDLVALLRERYTVAADVAALSAVLGAVDEVAACSHSSDTAAAWRLLKTRATHRGGVALSFLKNATEVRIPMAGVDAGRLAATLKAHQKKVRVADGELGLELDETTLTTIVSLIKGTQ